MVSEIVIGPVVIRVYGLLVAAGLLTAAWLAERLLRPHLGKNATWFWDMITLGVVGGLIGARAWHVATDWPLYSDNLVAAFYVWQGGMSILGGLLGGVLALALGRAMFKSWQSVSLFLVLDVLALVAPVGQAIGRLGNWVNQEVFGLPTELPWKLFVDERYRPDGFADDAYFHPLFAYEALLLLAFYCVMRVAIARYEWLKLGNGVVLLAYLGYYGFVRFFLEFLRIEKSLLTETIGVNQAILALVAIGAIIALIIRLRQLRKSQYDHRSL